MDGSSDYAGTPEAGIAEVLGAEKQALADIAACEERAEETLAEARRDVRATLRRTQERLARLHAGCAAKTREIIGDIEREAGSYEFCDLPEDGERLLVDKVVRAVAAELTSLKRDGD